MIGRYILVDLENQLYGTYVRRTFQWDVPDNFPNKSKSKF